MSNLAIELREQALPGKPNQEKFHTLLNLPRDEGGLGLKLTDHAVYYSEAHDDVEVIHKKRKAYCKEHKLPHPSAAIRISFVEQENSNDIKYRLEIDEFALQRELLAQKSSDEESPIRLLGASAEDKNNLETVKRVFGL